MSSFIRISGWLYSSVFLLLCYPDWSCPPRFSSLVNQAVVYLVQTYLERSFLFVIRTPAESVCLSFCCNSSHMCTDFRCCSGRTAHLQLHALFLEQGSCTDTADSLWSHSIHTASRDFDIFLVCQLLGKRVSYTCKTDPIHWGGLPLYVSYPGSPLTEFL